jgi:lysyl-tRNA synthetase class 1
VDGAPPADAYRPRFLRVAHLCQMPGVDVVAAIAREKGGPLSEADRRELELRVADARRWLRTYAPEAHRFEVQPTLPPAARALTDAQRRFLAALIPVVEQAQDGQTLHAAIHALKAQMGLAPKAAFGAIYLAFLGRDSGPQAGWFLAALDRAFVVQRLREAAGAVEAEQRHG